LVNGRRKKIKKKKGTNRAALLALCPSHWPTAKQKKEKKLTITSDVHATKVTRQRRINRAFRSTNARGKDSQKKP
jgi:hypothetical protein